VSDLKENKLEEKLVRQLEHNSLTMGKITKKRKIQYRIRKKVNGTAEIPRLSIFRSNKYIYCQLIDDLSGTTIADANSKALSAGSDLESAKKVGAAIAEKAKSKNVDRAVFDRGGNLYHGRVKALAEAAREAGLQF